MAEQYSVVPLSHLRHGTKINSAIFDGADVTGKIMLLAAGTTITPSLLARLQRRGVEKVRVSDEDLKAVVTVADQDKLAALHKKYRQTNEFSHHRNRISRALRGRRVTSESFLQQLHDPFQVSFSEFIIEEFNKQQAQSLAYVETMIDSLLQNDTTCLQIAGDVSGMSLIQIAEDIDLFVTLGTRPCEKTYPGEHCLKTAQLAMAIGTIHGLRHDELIDLGVGCLVHDVGMMMLNKPLWEYERELDAHELLELQKHPIRSLDLVKDNKHISHQAMAVIYQLHERMDGSGYPRRRKGNQIHHLAKIAAVADSYMAMTSDRPYRKAMLGYNAIEQILHDTSEGRYDQDVVRSFLHTVSLFPLGTYVELTDGRKGRVIRSNRKELTKPVVEVWDMDTLFVEFDVLDLRECEGLEVDRAIPPLLVHNEQLVTTES